MSDAEWNAVRWAFQRTVVSYRRLVVAYLVANGFALVSTAWMFVLQLWAPFGFALAGLVVVLAGAARLVSSLHDAQDRLEWIEGRW